MAKSEIAGAARRALVVERGARRAGGGLYRAGEASAAHLAKRRAKAGESLAAVRARAEAAEAADALDNSRAARRRRSKAARG